MAKKIPFLKVREVKLTPLQVVAKRRRTITAKRNSHVRGLVKPRTKRNENISSEYELWKSIGNLATALWRGQENPQKVYVGGHRVHHGPVGLGLVLGGLYLKNDAMIGFGEAIARDDLDDVSEWFRFEKEHEYNTYYA